MYLKLFCVTTYIYCLDDSFLTCRYTCCKDGELYHCCPLPEAVCCSDNIHCCPRGFECSPDNKRCSSGSHSILALSTALPKTVSKGLSTFLQQILKTVSKEWLSRTVQKRRQSVVMKEKVLENVICPDGQSECPDGSTCCKLSSGQWGCCPLPKAVCCSDGVHCCPNGYTCDTSAGTCNKGSMTVPMVQKMPSSKRIVRMVKANNVVCPDGQSECPDGSTCCKLSSGQWGCCPLPKAVCCSDGVHCCPNGYTCDTSAGTCNKGSMTVPMVQKMPSSKRIVRIVKANNVVCPDGQSECPDGSTCCKLSSGQWGCCPLPKAVCCSDGVHCCPNGYTCDPSAGTCNKGIMTVPMLQKMASSKKIVKANNVLCPGGVSECPDGNTCCKLASGQYGCCPLPKAVCCSDGVHCCPNGYTCDPSAGTCNKGIMTVPMLQKMASSKKIVKANNVLCPDGVSECPDGNTCCKLASGQYGCCPFPKAVCCSDGVHCCPNGYTCDTSAGTCKKNVVCPDGASECPDGNTCCKLASGQYGCCPLLKAVCCSDGVHCCPNGYTCDTSAGTCNKGIKTVPMVQKMLSSKRVVKANNVVCPDGASQCPDGNTCCKLASGQYGCCPLPKAVCCSDGVHCCPNGYTCDTSAGTCSKGIKTVPMVQKMLSSKRIVKANNVVCPDGASQCPDGNTCCRLSSGQYGCCPLPKAVCCSDGVHCCPNGYTCDTSAGTCNKGIKTVPMVQKMLSSKGIVKANNVVCPDGVSECPDGNTCCRLSSGQYGCCPLPKAVCCSDGVHCCPNGYTCDTSAGTCNKGSMTVPMVQKMPSSKRIVRIVKANNVVCPDGQSECPDGSTCCKLSSGQWGCCPFPKAVCCSDGVHCCPNGYTCDTSAGTCKKNVVCPDGASECPDGNTCCKLASGQYGCCPLPKAVCCSDGVHCCPNGYTCDTSAGTCNKGIKTVPMVQKMLSSKGIVKANNVVCPDGVSECPDGNTCCRLSSGQYGCCPLPKAVCCSDGVHCCPNGYTCDTSAGTCNKGSMTVPMVQKMPSSKRIVRIVKANNVVCPDGQSECPDGSTCCKLSSGQWGCCPFPKAVCCSDGVHCCPNGYTCDTSAGTCKKNVVCPDGASECPDGNTCCKLASGQYGCCPLPKAVCCSDGVHCCPNGYTCDTSAGTCNKGIKTVPMVQKMLSSKGIVKAYNVVCPDGVSECPDGNTCCRLSSGQYGCCPLPKAVCCGDGVHCCPNGYTCDTSAGTCNKGIKTVPMVQKMLSSKRIVKANNVVCPDGASECPDGNTCCKLASGQYGCCPLPRAVCCSDGEHCCPEGYTCDTSAGTCNKESKPIYMLQTMPSLKENLKGKNVICPDEESECPDGFTCCLLASGEYGCCPLPNAVCCSDGKHCCPEGYICDVSAGTCNRGSSFLLVLQKIDSLKRNAKVGKALMNNVICPGDKVQCPTNQTCCKLSSGVYGCCPAPDAVCCSDGEHCCPHGYICDLSTGNCIRDRQVLPLRLSVSNVKNVVCPDGASECPDGNTCCKLASGQYGCCPLPKAVCCSDGVHCCPNGYTCDTSAGTCNKGSVTVPMLQKMASLRRIVKGSNFVCPDGVSQCPDGYTCCKLASGQYGCCPLPKAVCCSDGVHCCPNGYTCDTSAGTCNKGSVTVPMLQKLPATRQFSKTNVCPDGSTECPGGYTCCKLASGEYGCCHYPNAVCCKDGEHCCPDGYTCNPSAGTCTEGGKSIPMLRKMPGLKRLVKATNVICPDGQSECPDGSTCCKLSSGQWGCCPLPKAVCCSDGVHCCPNGYTCDTSAGTCNKGSTTVPMLQEMLFSKNIVKAGSVVCPDGVSECPDGNTCCKLASGQWGCCPFPKAVCCSDGVHCCPNGYTCDTSAGTCNKGSMTQPMLRKMPSTKRIVKANNVVCPDGASECPDGNTCCRLSSGQYGCCPLPDAVCCSDGVHCCPNGYTCDTSAGTCNKGIITVPMLQTTSALTKTAKVDTAHEDVDTVFCPDGESECPNGYMCCKDTSGQYGCCPKDFTCNSNGTCHKDSERLVQTIMVSTKSPVDPVANSSVSVLCPDKKYQCPGGSTCCKLHSGSYGCCPIEKAVCCSDDKHCCPEGYTCDLKEG